MFIYIYMCVATKGQKVASITMVIACVYNKCPVSKHVNMINKKLIQKNVKYMPINIWRVEVQKDLNLYS